MVGTLTAFEAHNATVQINRLRTVCLLIQEVKAVIRKEIDLSGLCIGYRSMWRRKIYVYK